MRNRALIYLRKSEIANADNDLESHKIRMMELVKTLGAKFDPATDIFHEPEGHRSAQSNKRRPAFRKMMERVNAEKSDVRYILGNDRARIWRDDVEYGKFLRNIQSLGVEFIPATEPRVQDTNTAMGMAMEGMMGLFNAWYPRYVSEKLRDNYEIYRARHSHTVQNPPCGLKSSGEKLNRRIVVSDEWYEDNGVFRKYIDTPLLAFELYVDSEMGFREITRELNRRGYKIKPRVNGGEIYYTTVQKWVKNAWLYKLAGAIDEPFYERIVLTRKLRAHSKRGAVKHEPLMLSGLTVCRKCGARVGAENRGAYYNSIYKHPYNSCRWGGAIAARVLDEQMHQSLVSVLELSESDKREIASAHTQRHTDFDALRKTRDECLVMLENLEVSFLKGYLGNVETAFAKYESRKKKIEKELNETEGKMKAYETLESRISPETIYGLLSDLSVLFEDAADLDIAALNRMLRALYARVEIDFDTRTIYPVLVSQS